jgi:anti-sigma regulatory factor (Ser/Thr protein kinase)
VSLKARFDNMPGLAPIVRRVVTDYAETCGGFADAALSDIEVAVGEALANAVEHGRSRGGWIAAHCICRDDAFKVTISDNGPGFDHTRATPTSDPAESFRGFGLPMIRRLMDSVVIDRGGRTITMLKYSTPSEPLK